MYLRRRYWRRYDGEITQSTRQARAAILKRNGRDAGLDKCDVLAPVLPLLHTGRVDQGVRLLRELYRHADRSAFEASVLARMRSSPMWVPR